MNRRKSESAATEYLVGGYGLAKGDVLRVEQPREVLLYVPQGQVWITEEGGADDVIIGAGEWFRLRRPGVAVVEAFAPTVILLTSPHEIGHAERIETCSRPAPHARRAHRAWRGIRVAARNAARRIGRWIFPMPQRLRPSEF
jgi:hypothetical protein